MEYEARAYPPSGPVPRRADRIIWARMSSTGLRGNHGKAASIGMSEADRRHHMNGILKARPAC